MLEHEIDDFMNYCEYKKLAVKTIASYEATLRLFKRYIEDEQGIENAKEITPKHIRQYIDHIQTRGKYTVFQEDWNRAKNYPSHRRDYKDAVSPCTINNYLRNLRVFFNFLVDERRIRRCPVESRHFQKAPRRVKEYMTDEAFARLCKCIDDSKFSEYRDSVIIHLLLDTGMRIGECLMIRCEDLDIQRRAIFLPAEHTKGKADRFVFFGLEMARLLRRWLQYKDRYCTCDTLFCTKGGARLQVSNFETNMRKYCRRADIQSIHPHVLRNNFSKRFLMSGGDIFTLSRLLGHSSVTVTEQAYLDLTQDDLREKYQQYSPLANMRR